MHDGVVQTKGKKKKHKEREGEKQKKTMTNYSPNRIGEGDAFANNRCSLEWLQTVWFA